MRKIYIIIILIFSLNKVNAQDLHFSQFFNAPLNINPGLTAVYNEDRRFSSNLRSQWLSVPVPYTTFSMAYDQKILNDGRLGNHILGAGLIMNYDQAGDANMQNIQLGSSIAYTRQVAKMHFLSAGFRFLVAQRRFDITKLTFDNQFIDGTFIPTANTGENFSNFNYTYIDIGTGINWLFQISKRMNFNLGISGMHLNQPKATFFEDNTLQQAIRWNLQISGVIQLAQNIDLMPSAIFSMQGTQQERLFGSAIQYHLNQQFAKEKSIQIGTWYRMNDAIIAGFGLNYPTWSAMISYDLNTSQFSNATNGIGSVEFSFQYIIQTVKRMKDRKVCPIF